jgi:hypothetical protein
MTKLINVQRAPCWRELKYGYRLTAEETRRDVETFYGKAKGRKQ